ncbi:response regulator [Clostridium tagluense]|uniref:Stage 0 sporulation protein A homolog n=1 Tax=Clostridium tagluense TaxID=360422 RepID=A0A401UH48_9CLOT|nr:MULTISPECIES: response regulator [Clostridium]MBU3128322.1 response regulator [Clostridium tagluense]MBW9157620.1 response regulator [Clostridium tagluense]MBZ9622701.1 response regulator [Clostridium sp. FP2]MBZ9634246.1 response regulator [Clostridium sp. FP1]MCB2296390.1 response regulator [Clostridium tagluense]
MNKRIVIADDEPITRMDLKEILEAEGYDVVGEASDGFDAVELCRKHSPDLVLMDIKMPLLDGLNAAKIIQNENLGSGVVLITAYSGKEFVEKATKVGAIGYIVKPIDEKSLIPTLEVAISKSAEIKKIKIEIEKVSSKLEERKIVEKAKGLLMQRDKIIEQDAYDNIRTLSMKKRCSMGDIAQAIIMSYE